MFSKEVSLTPRHHFNVMVPMKDYFRCISVLFACFWLVASFPVEKRRARCSSTRSLYANNPNDNESPEESQARMELVRKIQASFYQEKDDGGYKEQWIKIDESDPSILYNLPLWRVQWTELPGYQNVLNVHVPHYTHMFRKLLAQTRNRPDQRFFGHVYLPDGSENLGNPDYFLPEDEDMENDDVQCTLTGTLMQITDYVEQNDGRLTLIVQGVAPMTIVTAKQQVPYAIAGKVKIMIDREAFEPLHLVLLSCSSRGGGIGYDKDTVYLRASCAVAAKELELLREVEFYQTSFNDGDDDSGGSRTISPTLEVSALTNMNASALVDWEQFLTTKQEAFRSCLEQDAEKAGNDELLLASRTLFPENWNENDYSYMWEDTELIELERDLWIQLDRLLKLLGTAQPGLKIPVPSQLLGLLPTDTKWPKGFRLEEYTEQLQAKKVSIGTASRSPFVRISNVFPEYPVSRRASRLSYAVWVFLEPIVAPIEGSRFNRQDLLETHIVCQRLQIALHRIKSVNHAIELLLGE